MEHRVPIAAPLLDGGDHGVVLAGLADGPEMVAERVDHRIRCGEFTAEPRDEPVPLVREPLPVGDLAGVGIAGRKLHFVS